MPAKRLLKTKLTPAEARKLIKQHLVMPLATDPAIAPTKLSLARFKPPFRVEFDSHGGYDGMSSAYIIRCKDELFDYIVRVDLKDFCDDDVPQRELRSENGDARAVAELICEMLNARIGS
jgi:hypothetical protein